MRVYCLAVCPVPVRRFIIFPKQRLGGVREGFLFALILPVVLSVASGTGARERADTFSEKTDMSEPFLLRLSMLQPEQFILEHTKPLHAGSLQLASH